MGGESQPTLKLMIVDDSNIIRRRIERSQQIARLEVVGAASNGHEEPWTCFAARSPTS